ncbi:MAG: conjugal transfer protein TrbH [Methylococcus sp.]|nr:conjugal transfer protein TrbH [Methylococcus sp.]
MAAFYVSRVFQMALIAGAIHLAGCAAQPSYGNFTRLSEGAGHQLAADTVQQLAALYPPARTHFQLIRTDQDAFGAALSEALRAKGYALEDAAPPAKLWQRWWSKPNPMAEDGLALRYVVDRQAGADLYWVKVTVGNASLTRAYRLQDNALVAAGAWVRKA